MALLHYFLLSFLTIASELGLALHSQDLLSLLSFKASVDPLNTLLYTWEGSNPCSGLWVGIQCYHGRVVGIYLDDASLVGSATPLFGLGQLQVLSLGRNALNGSLPHLTNLTNPRLRHLFLSHNQFDGTLNISLPFLLSLRIEHNDFFGRLEGLHLPSVVDFNVSVNQLAGEISGSLSKFPSSAFNGNPTLCGSPLASCSKISHLSNATNTSPSPAPIVISTCSSSRSLSKLGIITVLLSIGIGDMVVIAIALAIVIGMYTWFKRRFSMPPNATTGARGFELDHGFVEEKEMDRRLVCFEGGEDLRLDSLLKASAEVMGKGISGSTYKAVLEDGIMVAVKRLSAVQFPSHSKAFNQRMHLIGRLRHCHVMSLRAYCNAHEEKLLVYDYMPGGSLHSLLQSNRGRNLDWRGRKQILMGVAHGLNFIHTFPARPPLVHANIKPSNILIDEQGNACISECSIMCFATNFHQSLLPNASTLFPERMNSAAASAWHGYRAPELSVGKAKATQESDVYSFGMVLLEVVTDKGIDDGECEGEMMGMVKIGMLCTAECSEERPKMSQVLRMMSEFL